MKPTDIVTFKFFDKLPKDVQIVAYCSCPRAAADSVINKLRERGYSKTAVLYEGIFGWMNLGYPVARRDLAEEFLHQPETTPNH